MIERNHLGIPTTVAVVLALATILFSGCTTSGSGTSQASASRKGGAQLWAENCLRCHNSRSPSSYSDGEWEVAMHHMRVRANLTAEEHRIILEFLKASN